MDELDVKTVDPGDRLRQRGETRLPVPLDLLNATLGRIVKIKKLED